MAGCSSNSKTASQIPCLAIRNILNPYDDHIGLDSQLRASETHLVTTGRLFWPRTLAEHARISRHGSTLWSGARARHPHHAVRTAVHICKRITTRAIWTPNMPGALAICAILKLPGAFFGPPACMISVFSQIGIRACFENDYELMCFFALSSLVSRISKTAQGSSGHPPLLFSGLGSSAAV